MSFLVLKYLESMKRSELDSSMLNDDVNRAPTPKSDRKLLEQSLLAPSPKRGRAAQQLEELANSDVRSRNGKPMTNGEDVEEDFDGGSNVQDGRRSDAGDIILPIVCLTPHPAISQHLIFS